MNKQITLREVLDEDLATFFDHHQDPKANDMAVFTSPDPNDGMLFQRHWGRILSDPAIIAKTIVADGQVVGNIMAFEMDGRPEISYWIGQEFWGQGITTVALSQLLALHNRRPLYARAAKDNIGSLRVLQKCGFVIIGEDKGFSNARKMEVEEFVLRLDSRE